MDLSQERSRRGAPWLRSMERAEPRDTLADVIDNAFRRILPGHTHFLIQTYQALRLSPNAISVLGCLIGAAAAVCV